jgi:hypothetical protein
MLAREGGERIERLDRGDPLPAQRHHHRHHRHRALHIRRGQLPCQVVGDEVVALEDVGQRITQVREQPSELHGVEPFELGQPPGALEAEEQEARMRGEHRVGVQEVRSRERVDDRAAWRVRDPQLDVAPALHRVQAQRHLGPAGLDPFPVCTPFGGRDESVDDRMPAGRGDPGDDAGDQVGIEAGRGGSATVGSGVPHRARRRAGRPCAKARAQRRLPSCLPAPSAAIRTTAAARRSRAPPGGRPVAIALVACRLA